MKKENLKSGYTTGACAAVAAKAAACLITGDDLPEYVEITLANGDRARMKVEEGEKIENGARAAVIKDAGDDPDITHGSSVFADVFMTDRGEVQFEAGEGVGTVMRAGLSVPVGEPAINPGPRRMITEAVREVTDIPLVVRVSIPGGEKLAQKTFNPKLGVEGGLSILGTTGIVRPYSCDAIRQSIMCLLNVALAAGVRAPVFTPGNIGTKAAIETLKIKKETVVEIGNEWGFIMDSEPVKKLEAILAVGHPGKLGKLITGQWDTHSKNSTSAVPIFLETAEEALGFRPDADNTVEEIFSVIDERQGKALGDLASKRIAEAIGRKVGRDIPVSVVLINMVSKIVGAHGDLSRWSG